MKNNEIFREPKLFSGVEAYAEGEADQIDASVPARGTAKIQGLSNGLP